MFVIQQPHSNTNSSDKFRVTDSEDLMKFMNGAATSYSFVSFDTYGEALAKRDEMNSMNVSD